MKITLRQTRHYGQGTLWAGRPYQAKRVLGRFLVRLGKSTITIKESNVLHVLD